MRWVSISGHGSTTRRAIDSASGPLTRTTPMPPPAAVAMAAIVVALTANVQLVRSRQNHQPPERPLALAARRHTRKLVQRQVNDAPIVGAHRAHGDRPIRPLDLLAERLGHLDQRLFSPAPIALGIEQNWLPSDGIAVDDLVDQILQRVQGRALLADDQTALVGGSDVERDAFFVFARTHLTGDPDAP